jgi:hypothetical protein
MKTRNGPLGMKQREPQTRLGMQISHYIARSRRNLSDTFIFFVKSFARNPNNKSSIASPLTSSRRCISSGTQRYRTGILRQLQRADARSPSGLMQSIQLRRREPTGYG